MKTKLCLLSLVAALSVLTGCTLTINDRPNSGSQTSESSSQSSSSSSNSQSSSSSQPEPEPVVFNDQNPNATAASISSIISAQNDKKLYRITGTAQIISNTNYGNFDLVDNTGYIYVYGCGKYDTCIIENNGSYSFGSASGFASMSIKAGDEVTMEGVYTYYSGSGGVHEFMGYVTQVRHRNQYNISAKSYTASEPTNQAGNYYSSISDSDSGSTLATKIHSLMNTTHTYYTSYGSLSNYFKTSDKYPSGNVKCFYSGSNTSSYNREHVWPVSLSNNLFDRENPEYGGADLHHVRPTKSNYNSARSNAAFGPIYKNNTGYKSLSYSGGGNDYYTQNVFEPADAIKGDVARIIMYVYFHYSSSFGSEQTYYGSLSLSKVMAPVSDSECKNLLRKWNAEDPVSQDEITRNNYTYSVQHNRNPFIDHPTYADRIWG